MFCSPFSDLYKLSNSALMISRVTLGLLNLDNLNHKPVPKTTSAMLPIEKMLRMNKKNYRRLRKKEKIWIGERLLAPMMVLLTPLGVTILKDISLMVMVTLEDWSGVLTTMLRSITQRNTIADLIFKESSGTTWVMLKIEKMLRMNKKPKRMWSKLRNKNGTRPTIALTMV